MKIVRTNTPRDVVLHEDEYPANLDPTDVVEIFETPLTGSYNWDYPVQDNRIKKLYELGKELQKTLRKEFNSWLVNHCYE